MMSTLVRAEAAVLPEGVIRDAAIVVQDGQVRFAGAAGDAPDADRELRIDGTLLPGLVDIQVNGMGGPG